MVPINSNTLLATISAWINQRTNSHMLKEHPTTTQCVMWEDLKRRLHLAHQCCHRKPSIENIVGKARLIRGLQVQKLRAVMDESRRQNIVQAEVRAATVKALKMAEIAHDQVACGSCIFNISQAHFTAVGSGAV